MKIHPLDLAHLVRSGTIFVSTVILIIGVLIVSYWSSTNQETVIRDTAIDTCYHVATVSFETRDEKSGQVTKSELPATDVFQQCLKDKGIESK